MRASTVQSAVFSRIFFANWFMSFAPPASSLVLVRCFTASPRARAVPREASVRRDAFGQSGVRARAPPHWTARLLPGVRARRARGSGFARPRCRRGRLDRCRACRRARMGIAVSGWGGLRREARRRMAAARLSCGPTAGKSPALGKFTHPLERVGEAPGRRSRIPPCSLPRPVFGDLPGAVLLALFSLVAAGCGGESSTPKLSVTTTPHASGANLAPRASTPVRRT